MRTIKGTNPRVVGAIVFGVLGLLTAIFIRLMNYEIRRDEQMYATPALLLERYDLYTDIFYNHVPGSAWLFRLVMVALGTDHLLMAARLGVFCGWLLFSASVGWITYRLTRSPVMTLFAVLLILSNDTLLGTTGMAATNNMLPMPFAYLGLGLFVLGVADDRGRPLLIAAGGLSLALAASTKGSAIAFIPPVAIAAFFLPLKAKLAARLQRVVLPLAAGGIAGALPVLLYLAADSERFLAHVVGFHTGPHVAYWAAQTGSVADVAMSAGAKAKLAYLTWFSGTNMLFIFMVVLLLVHLARGGSPASLVGKLLTGPILLVSAAFLAAFVMSFIPTPGFPQYFAPPLVCSPLLLALLYDRLDQRGRLRMQQALIAASVVVVMVNAPRLTQHLARLPFPEKWTVSRVHQNGIAIARRLADAGVSGKVATIAPLYPLEAGLSVYPELATGQFAYRTAAFTSDNLKRFYRTTTPTEIRALLDADPPAALLVGFEPELEAPMVRFAQDRGYLRVVDLGLTDRYGTGILYIRPGNAAQ